MSEAWRRRVLYVAGAWNIVGGVSALLDPPTHFAQLYRSAMTLSDPVQAFFFRATWINAIAWGFAYTLAARAPSARAPVLIAGGTGKLTYFVLCVWAFRGGSGTVLLLAAGVVDLVFAVFFAYALSTRRDVERPVSR